MPYVDVDMYAKNKAFELPQDIQESILKKMSILYEQSQQHIKHSTKYYIIKNFLEDCGIYIAHDWPFHEKGFFFPNYEDAEYLQVYLDEIVG